MTKEEFLQIFSADPQCPIDPQIIQLNQLLSQDPHYKKHFYPSTSVDNRERTVYCFLNNTPTFYQAFLFMILLTMHRNWSEIKDLLNGNLDIHYAKFFIISDFDPMDYCYIKNYSGFHTEGNLRACAKVSACNLIVERSDFHCIKVVFEVRRNQMSILTVFPMKKPPNHGSDTFVINAAPAPCKRKKAVIVPEDERARSIFFQRTMRGILKQDG